MKETTVQLATKEMLAFMKDDKGFADYIAGILSRELADRLIQILNSEGEVIVKQSDLKVSEVMKWNQVEYRRSIEWEHLVRCKDCKHGRPYKHTKDYVSCEVDCDPIDRDSDFFCKSGERRE